MLLGLAMPLDRLVAPGQEEFLKTVKIVLGHTDTGGGVVSWQNPEAGIIIIEDVTIDVTAVATGACSIDVGTTATDGTTKSDNLIDGLDVHSAVGVFGTADQAGANGKTRAKLASGKWLTISMDSGAAAGLQGSCFVSYFLA